MSDPAGMEAEVLETSADPHPEDLDHPDDLTEEEAAEGEVVYHEVDDLDDESNGLDDESNGLDS